MFNVLEFYWKYHYIIFLLLTLVNFFLLTKIPDGNFVNMSWTSISLFHIILIIAIVYDTPRVFTNEHATVPLKNPIIIFSTAYTWCVEQTVQCVFYH